MIEKERGGRKAWRPAMPRRARAILRNASEMASEYGWSDEAIAAIHAARDAGWTLQEIADVLRLTRERVRQLYERESDAAITNFPQKPERPAAPRPVPGYVLRRGLVSPEEIAELAEMQKVAKYRRRGGDSAKDAIAEEFWSRVNHLVQLGVPHSWLSRQMGLSATTLRMGLGRYGYRAPCPSQPQRRTGEESRRETVRNA